MDTIHCHFCNPNLKQSHDSSRIPATVSQYWKHSKGRIRQCQDLSMSTTPTTTTTTTTTPTTNTTTTTTEAPPQSCPEDCEDRHTCVGEEIYDFECEGNECVRSAEPTTDCSGFECVGVNDPVTGFVMMQYFLTCDEGEGECQVSDYAVCPNECVDDTVGTSGYHRGTCTETEECSVESDNTIDCLGAETCQAADAEFGSFQCLVLPQ